ncbi:hypothetical protein EYA86_10900 [Mediterraneibacter sp. gm002]|nr:MULTISPECIES: hypothetical protein [Clostridia]RKQ28110.1 hypothetical protein D8Q48_10410 [Ruminococcus sp. B05]TAP32201.1 hypothetical protein EYA86_10900 [Mediterraneibacter sp. gm002]
MFPIKYIDNNLVWNKDNEVFAYYELIPYNYSFLSAEQKFIVHDSFRQLIAQSREGKIHALQIATESSIRSMQEQSKKLVTGKLKEVACQKIDEQTEALVSMIGDNQVDYRFFLGFKLMVTEEQLNLKNIKKSAWLTFKEFLHEVNHTLMNDFVSMPNDEINRYMKMEKLLENKISRRFKVRRLEIHDFGYAVYSAKEKAKSSVSDFKRGMVQEQQSRQTGRLEKQEQHRQNIADKRMELQKAQEARQRKTDGSATTGATRPHERPATASTIPKPSAEKMQEVKRPATATTSKASEPVKTNVVKERPLSSGASDKKATQPAQPVHRQNVEKVVSQETRQNYKAERTTKKQTFEQSKRTTEHTEKNRNLVTKKGQKKK